MTESDRVAASLTGALVAAASAVAGMSGHADEAVVVATLSSALQPMLQVQAAWCSDVLIRFLRRGNYDASEFESDLIGSQAKQELLIRALDISRTAAAEEKRRAIAASLCKGFVSDLDASKENDVLRVIADLDLAHVLALVVLNEPRTLANRAAFLNPIHYEKSDLGKVDARLAGLEERLCAVLTSHGLVVSETVSTYDTVDFAYRITDFGRTVLQRFADNEVE